MNFGCCWRVLDNFSNGRSLDNHARRGSNIRADAELFVAWPRSTRKHHGCNIVYGVEPAVEEV
jgi:hypothetical protein